jgi:hypothetical protein
MAALYSSFFGRGWLTLLNMLLNKRLLSLAFESRLVCLHLANHIACDRDMLVLIENNKLSRASGTQFQIQTMSQKFAHWFLILYGRIHQSLSNWALSNEKQGTHSRKCQSQSQFWSIHPFQLLRIISSNNPS